MDVLLKYVKNSLGLSSPGKTNRKDFTRPIIFDTPSWAGYNVPLQHHLVYEKMELLLVRMQSKNSGIKSFVQNNKNENDSLTFTGSQLVSWVKKNTTVNNEVEALFLSNKLYTHGYVIPIDVRTRHIKNDGTRYCFQSYYYFPSQWPNPVDREYAVYLCQRVMKNASPLQLSESEAHTLASYKRNLNRKWKIVLTESIAQVLVSKRRGKKLRRTLDTQERGFWDVHRPLPGVVNTTEIDYKKLNKDLKGDFTKKKDAEVSIAVCETSEPNDVEPTVESLKEEIASLQQELVVARRRANASKTADLYINYYERYVDYDPLLRARDSKNPWTWSRPGEWPAAKQNEITESRVLRWSFDMKDLMADAVGREHFKTFVEKEFSDENLRFWNTVKDYKNLPFSLVPRTSQAIWDEYFKSEILNVDSQSKYICQHDLLNPHLWTFDVVAIHVYQLMKNDSYPRFLRSEIYKECLKNAAKKKTSMKGIKSLFSYKKSSPMKNQK